MTDPTITLSVLDAGTPHRPTILAVALTDPDQLALDWVMDWQDGTTDSDDGAPPATLAHQYDSVGPRQPVLVLGYRMDTDASVAVEVAPDDPFAYFTQLSARPDCVAAYSLRDAAQLALYRQGSGQPPFSVTYDYANDPDPRKQDAAKISINGNSLPSNQQIHLPSNHQPHTSLFVTWDDWNGAEFAFANTDIGKYKKWNLCSPVDGIYTELRAEWKLAKDVPGTLTFTSIRQYSENQQGPNVAYGPVMNGRNYGGEVIGPMIAEFGVAPETWTRYWIYLESHPDWYRLSCWAADVTRDPVQIYGGLQIRPKLQGSGVSIDGNWGVLRLEYNTSSGVQQGTRPLIGYARNVVMLRDIPPTDVPALLQKPTA